MPSDRDIGAELHGCAIEAELGRGGMGVVYRAHQRSLDRRVALKLITLELSRDPAFRQRFERESRVAASIDHPHVVPLYEAGEEDGELFLIMRYVEGTDLGAVIAEEERLDPPRAARILRQIGSALDAAHSRGLVHRDVKPANVLLSGEGVDEHAYLSDFGLTKDAASESALTHTGQWVGTADYVAPEQLEGRRIDARTDVYALGCLLHQALTGAVPFSGGEIAKMFAHVNSPAPTPSASNAGLGAFDAVVARAMAKDPAERFPSAGDLGRAAEAAARGGQVEQRERSVATGAAAPVPSPAAPTRLDRAPVAPAPPRRHPPPAPTDPLPPGGDERSRGRPGMAVALVLSTALAAVAGIAIAMIVARDDGEPVAERSEEDRSRRDRRAPRSASIVTQTAPSPSPGGEGSGAGPSPVGATRFSTPRDPGQTYPAAYCRINSGEAGESLYCWTPNDGYTLVMPTNGPGARARTEEAQNKGLAPPGHVELGFGETSSAAGFTCTSRSSGLECTNTAGYGWVLPRYKGLPRFFSP